MEMSRRENEQQIIQIRVCMKEMMSELLEYVPSSATF